MAFAVGLVQWGIVADFESPDALDVVRGDAQQGPDGNGNRRRARLSAVYVARHGETQSNVERRYAGAGAEPLTPAGRAQAVGLAERLGGVGIQEIRTSEIARAFETAHIVSGRLGVPVVSDARLNEMRMGPWEGLTECEVEARDGEAYRTWLSDPDRLALPGRETLAELAARVVPAVRESAASGRRVLLISHVAPIRVAALSVLKVPLSAYKRVSVRNVDCLRFDVEAAVAEHVGGEALRRDALLADPS